MAGGASTCNFHLSDLEAQVGESGVPGGLWHEAPCLDKVWQSPAERTEKWTQNPRRKAAGSSQGSRSPGLSPSKASPSPLWPPPSHGNDHCSLLQAHTITESLTGQWDFSA